ncbi:hypothetical protein DPMN_002944, partial [Dreissena polymorpha]
MWSFWARASLCEGPEGVPALSVSLHSYLQRLYYVKTQSVSQHSSLCEDPECVPALSVSQHSSLCGDPECVPALVIIRRPSVCPSTRDYVKAQRVSQHSYLQRLYYVKTQSVSQHSVCPSTRHYVKTQSVSQHSSLCEDPECVPAL